MSEDEFVWLTLAFDPSEHLVLAGRGELKDMASVVLTEEEMALLRRLLEAARRAEQARLDRTFRTPDGRRL